MIIIEKQKINTTFFPDKTRQVWKLNESILSRKEVTIDWLFRDDGEIIELAQLKDLLDSRGIKANLKISYLPYGRQDKEINNNTTFGLYTFSKLLNILNFESVCIDDPHSEVSLKLINKSSATYPSKMLDVVFNKILRADIVIYPDKGAVTKYSKIYQYPFLSAKKNRDQTTGTILSYEMEQDIDEIGLKGKRVLIVDDICDGGATFLSLTELLKRCKVENISLFVSHGLFTKGVSLLRESGIDRIFTKDGEVFRDSRNEKGFVVEPIKEIE